MGVFDLFKKRAEEPVDEPPAGAGQGPAPATEAAEAAPQQSWFGKLRTALKKTHDLLNTDIRDLFKREGRLVDEDFLRELFAILVKTDMGTDAAPMEIPEGAKTGVQLALLGDDGSTGGFFHLGQRLPW